MSNIPAIIWQFLKLLASRFFRHKGPANAGSLAYTTLLSLVPLMTVVLAIFSAFPVADRVAEVIQHFIFNNFVPTSGAAVENYLEQFSANAGKMSGVGTVALLVVALLLMEAIDSTLNDIWEVRRQRSLLRKFMIYWAVLSLGPVLIAVSVLASSYLISLPLVSEATATGWGHRVLGWIPMAASALAFWIIYWLVPNRFVRGWHALLGGLLAAWLFELAKSGFALYVTTFPSYQTIYGAMAAIPLFLVWLYVTWLVVLLGAEFTHCLGIFRHESTIGRGHGSKLEALIGVLRDLGRAQESGVALSSRALSVHHAHIEALLHDMQSKKLVQRTEERRWVLARSLQHLSLYQLYRDMDCSLPVPDEAGWPEDKYLADLYRKAHDQLAEALHTPISELISEKQ